MLLKYQVRYPEFRGGFLKKTISRCLAKIGYSYHKFGAKEPTSVVLWYLARFVTTSTLIHTIMCQGSIHLSYNVKAVG